MFRLYRYALVVILLMVSTSIAGDLESLSVTEEGGIYKLSITTFFDVPEEYVYNVITDYENAYRISPTITEIELLPAHQEDAIRVRNHSRHCLGSLCLKIDWAGEITEPVHGHLVVSTIPEISSFESGHAKWEITRIGERTRIVHESMLKPDFFIPPVIGESLLKSHIETDTLATFNRIECLAEIMHKLDKEKDPVRLKSIFDKGWECIRVQS